VSTYDLLADLPLEVEDYALEGLERDVSSGFTRATTVIRLRGHGEEGIGEDRPCTRAVSRPSPRPGSRTPR
jgi:hypothetical protein